MLKSIASIVGRMYLTEGYVCFGASLLGIEQKVKLPNLV